METPLPTAEKLQSLNVEESRARRLERQQARLRDRGGIFRPENRNNNLFDILVQAAHRKSPVKGRGRSRSRSISPQKKGVAITNTQKKSSKRSSHTPSHKSITTPGDDKDRTLPKGSKGKRKQVVEMDDIEEQQAVKSKSRSRKVASVQKKGKTNILRQRVTKASIDETTEQNTIPAQISRGTKPKGKRKKTDAVGDLAKSPPLRSKKSNSAKTKSLPQNDPVDVSEAIDAAQRTRRNRASSARQNSTDPAYDGLPLKVEKTSRTAEDKEGGSTSHITKCRSNRPNKRKAEVEAVGTDAELRPAKRQPLSMSRSGATVDEDSGTRSKECTSIQLDSVVPATIKGTTENLPQATDYEKSLYPKQTTKKFTSKISKDSVRLNNQDDDPGLDEVAASKTEGKRPRAQAEFDEETTNIKNLTKKPKTSSPKDIPQPSVILSREEKGYSPEPKLNKRNRENKKRREITAVMRKKVVQAPRNKRQKDGSHALARVMRELNAQCDDYVSDDDPDPIDFLS